MNFNDALAKALRYSTDTIHTLLTELQKPDYDHHRWGSDDIEPTQGLRGVLADAMDEQGRDTEANLLRTKGQHVLVDGQSKVRPAQFTDRHITNATNALLRHTFQWSDDQWNPPAIDWENVHGHTPADWDEDGYFGSGGDDPHKPYGYGTVRVSYLHDDYAHTTHYSQLGKHVADNIEEDVNRVDYGWNTDGPNAKHMGQEFDRLVEGVRNAPYEEVDVRHRTENQRIRNELRAAGHNVE